MISIAFYNFFGLSVTKYASAAQRATLDISRTVLIWVFFLLYPGQGKETFYWLQLIGFVILVLGTLVFNEIIIIPFCGFDCCTKDALRAADQEQTRLNKDFPQKHSTYGAMEKRIIDPIPNKGSLD